MRRTFEEDARLWEEVLARLPDLERNVIRGICGTKNIDYVVFKKKFFDRLPGQDQESIKRFLVRVFPEAVNWPYGMGKKLASVCADLELDELKDQLWAVFEQQAMPTAKGLGIQLRVLDLELPKQLRFIFTEPYSPGKSTADYERFLVEFDRLHPKERQAVKKTILELTEDEEPRIAQRAILALALIDRELARPAAERMWPNVEAKRRMPKDLKKFLGIQ